jgi:LEA14-like dessication related protein
LLVSLLLVSCLEYQDIQFKGIQNIEVKEFTQKNIELEITALINNPNNYNISIVGSDLDLYIGGSKVGKAELGKKVKFLKKQQRAYSVVVKTDLKNATGGIAGLMGVFLTKKAKISIKGTITGKARGVRKKFPVDFTENISL